MAKIIDKRALQTLEKKKKELLLNLKRLDEAILAIKGEEPFEVAWTFKALECLKGWNEFLQTNDILECILYEKLSLLDDPARRRTALTGLSVALNKMVKNGILIRVPHAGLQGYFYGLPEWLTHEKTMKHEYKKKFEDRLRGKMTG